MATDDPCKEGKKYGISFQVQRDLTPEEADHVAKTLKMTVSALRLSLKDNVICEKPNAPRAPRKCRALR